MIGMFAYGTAKGLYKRKQKKIPQLPGTCPRREQIVEHEGDGNTNRSWSHQNII